MWLYPHPCKVRGQVHVCFSDLASSYLELCVSGRPVRAGAPVQERGEGAGENAQLGGKAWPALSSGSAHGWLPESHPTQQVSPVSG